MLYDKQLKILKHAWGYDSSTPGFRTHYCTDRTANINMNILVEKGMFREIPTGVPLGIDHAMFVLTKEAIAFLKGLYEAEGDTVLTKDQETFLEVLEDVKRLNVIDEPETKIANDLKNKGFVCDHPKGGYMLTPTGLIYLRIKSGDPIEFIKFIANPMDYLKDGLYGEFALMDPKAAAKKYLEARGEK